LEIHVFERIPSTIFQGSLAKSLEICYIKLYKSLGKGIRLMVKKEVSFKRKLIMAELCLTVPLILLLFISNVYSTQMFNGKIADSHMRSMYDRASRIEEGLDSVDDFLTGVLASSVDFRTLSGGAAELNAHLASYALFNQIKIAMPAYEDVGAFFIYSVPSRTERDMFTSEFDYAEKTAIRAFVREAVDANIYNYNMRWRHAEIDGASYLFRFYGGRGTYLVAMVPLERLGDTSVLRLENEAVMLFVDDQNQPLTGRTFIEANGIDLNGDYSHYFISGEESRYMIVGQELANTDCRAVLAVGGAGYFSALNIWQILLFAASILVLVLIPILQMHLTRSISEPMDEICGTMKQIRAGKLDAKVQGNTNIREFREMNETFNTMMAQIKDLKIASYEHEIETQKAQLRYLQLQIRPHFFLNCLKSLYALAESGKYDRIQKMILQISKHIRYIFTDSMELVPLSRELDHIRNYIEMQGDSSQYAPICRIDADPLLLDLPIPPLSLQTFVENSIKHDYSPDHPLEIDVRVSILCCGSDAFADLTVSDNGSGFPESVIQEINDPDSPLYTQRHVGINNIKKRMSLIYGDSVLYAFFNRDSGSVSEIFIPINLDEIQKKQKEGEQNS
jgi:two-component system sensor histidine kinase YesM